MPKTEYLESEVCKIEHLQVTQYHDWVGLNTILEMDWS